MNPSSIERPTDSKATKCSECGKPTCNCSACQLAKGGPHICNRCARERKTRMLVVVKA